MEGKAMKKKILIIVVAVIVVLGLGAVAYHKFFSHKGGDESQAVYIDDESAVMEVEATASQVKINLSNIGNGGSAEVLRYLPNEYQEKDSASGLVEENAEGVSVGTYNCGETATVTIDRYAEDGHDCAYDKYYLVQDKTLLKGPIYATSYEAQRTSTLTFKTSSKKGYAEEITGSETFATAKALDAKNAATTVDVSTILLANEDAEGNPIDRTKAVADGQAIEFKASSGTYYYSTAGLAPVDELVRNYTGAKMNVTMNLWARATTDWSSYPKALTYTDQNYVTMAFNTKDKAGLDYFTAMMEFFAQRYSTDDMRVQTFVLGNEIDQAYNWGKVQDSNKKVSLATYMEEYSRGLRLANNVVKKYSSEMSVCMPTGNSWAVSRYEGYGGKERYSKKARIKNSYAPKKMYDWLIKTTKRQGDYDWGMALHPYAISYDNMEPMKNDMKCVETEEKKQYQTITADYETSPFLTSTNLEILQQYLDDNQYNGQTRSVYLTETGIPSMSETDSTYLNRHAAVIAQYYYRAASMPCVKQITYYTYLTRDTDDMQPEKMFGMYNNKGDKKPVFELWKNIDTSKSFDYSSKYLKYLEYYDLGGGYHAAESGNISSYYDVMFASNSSYDWKSNWVFKEK